MIHFSSRRRCHCIVAVMLTIVTALAAGLSAAKELAESVDSAKLNAAIAKAAGYFEQAQADDGSFSAGSGYGPGITAIVATSLLRNGRGPDDPMIAKALKYLEQNR